MTTLPLVGRELRVRARSPAGYWTRFAAALAGMLVCLPALMMYPGARPNPALMGATAFNGLIVCAFVLCCFSGFLTVDGISRERREGTLGLLFLTRVRAMDVLLGNFGAAGLAGLCALAAFVPVIMVPILAGGVNGGEAARKVLALFDTMILSLAAGLWASARNREWWSSARSAAWLLLLLILVPQLLGTPMPFSALGLPGPLSALGAASDMIYRKSAAPYWISIAFVHAVSWLLVIGAGIRLRRALREEDEPVLVTPESKAPEHAEKPKVFMLAHLQIKFPTRKTLADREAPMDWLVRRQPGMKAIVWLGVLLKESYLGMFFLIMAFSRGVWLDYYQWSLQAFSLVGNCLFAWVASRFFLEARRAGELELLTTTPEGAKTIVASQWRWLKKIFRWPLVVLIVPWGLVFIILQRSMNNLIVSYSILEQLIYTFETLFGVAALLWVAMWFGWSERTQARAIARIVLLVQGVPYIIAMLGSKVVASFMSPWGYTGSIVSWSSLVWYIPQILQLAFYLWLIRWAMRRLKLRFTWGLFSPITTPIGLYD